MTQDEVRTHARRASGGAYGGRIAGPEKSVCRLQLAAAAELGAHVGVEVIAAAGVRQGPTAQQQRAQVPEKRIRCEARGSESPSPGDKARAVAAPGRIGRADALTVLLATCMRNRCANCILGSVMSVQ